MSPADTAAFRRKQEQDLAPIIKASGAQGGFDRATRDQSIPSGSEGSALPMDAAKRLALAARQAVPSVTGVETNLVLR